MAQDGHGTISALGAGLAGRCPRCGRGKLFRGFLAVAEACGVCGLDFGFADSGDGPAVFVTLFGGFAVLGAALWLELAYEPPIWVHVAVSLPLALIVCVGMLRPLKGVMIAQQFRTRAQEGELK